MFYPKDKKIIQILHSKNVLIWNLDMRIWSYLIGTSEGSDEPGHPSVQSYPSFAAAIHKVDEGSRQILCMHVLKVTLHICN